MKLIEHTIPQFNLFMFSVAAAILAQQNHIEEGPLLIKMAGAIRNGKLKVRDPKTGAYFVVDAGMDNPSPYVTIQDVNTWLSSNGYPYQWTSNSVKVVNVPASASAQGNTAAIRRDVLTPSIEAAIKAADNYESADVYLQLKELALGGVLPFSGQIEGSDLHYTNALNQPAVLKKSALAQRLKRLKKRAENSTPVA